MLPHYSVWRRDKCAQPYLCFHKEAIFTT
uniref:Uncharacterized protein n=1 Tax=Rhizophora mucronata TaxID=61149 RepID=A0A2P2QJ48_RHIMU